MSTFKRDSRKMKSSELNFSDLQKGCTLAESITIVDISQELEVFSSENKIIECQTKWCNRVERIRQDHLSEVVLNYKSGVKPIVKRPKTRRCSLNHEVNMIMMILMLCAIFVLFSPSYLSLSFSSDSFSDTSVPLLHVISCISRTTSSSPSTSN